MNLVEAQRLRNVLDGEFAELRKLIKNGLQWDRRSEGALDGLMFPDQLPGQDEGLLSLVDHGKVMLTQQVAQHRFRAAAFHKPHLHQPLYFRMQGNALRMFGVDLEQCGESGSQVRNLLAA